MISGHCNTANPPRIHAQCRGAYEELTCTCGCHAAAPEPETPRHGFEDAVPEAEYHADRASLSVSGAKLILKAPALYRHRLDHPTTSDAFDFGTAAHALVLGAGASMEPVAADDWRSKTARDERDRIRAEGAVPLLTKDYQRVRDMADALSSHTLAMRLLTGGRPEVSAYAVHEPTGVLRRCRYDYLAARHATDYKTTACAEPGAFAAACARYGYHQQAAWYLDVADALGQPLDAFAFIAQEKEPPYLVTVVELDDAAIRRGRELNDRALERFRDCTASGIWPGYQAADTYARIALPRWAFYDDDLQEMTA